MEVNLLYCSHTSCVYTEGDVLVYYMFAFYKHNHGTAPARTHWQSAAVERLIAKIIQ